jgi:hypothetical protein
MRRGARAVVILAAVAVLAIGGNTSVRSFAWPASDGQAVMAAPHTTVNVSRSRLVPRWDGDGADDPSLAQ